MKKIRCKRLIYHNITTQEILYGGEEYDRHLTDDNILSAIHTVGKTAWIGPNLYTIKVDVKTGKLSPIYRIAVEPVYEYKSFFSFLHR